MAGKLYLYDAAKSFYLHIVLIYQTVIAHELSYAAYAVSAHPALRAVEIEHSHLAVGYLRLLYQYNAVAADAEVAV